MPLLSFHGTAFLATLFLSVAAMPTSKPAQGVSLVLSLEVPSSVDNVGEFTVTGTLKSDSTKDIKVVTDPSGILFDYFAPDVLDFKKESYEMLKNSDNITEVDLEEQTMPMFVGARAKWSIGTYLVDDGKEDTDGEAGNKDTQSWASDGSSSGSSDYASDDDANSSQPSEADSSNTSAGSSQGEGKTYPAHTTHDLKAGESMEFTYKVGQGYDFTKSGAGVYNVKLSRDFFWVLVDDVLTTVKVDVKSSKVTIKGKLTGKLPPPKKNKVSKWDINKREELLLGTIDCPAIAIPIILRSARIAMKLVDASIKSLNGMDAVGSDRTPYELWFGPWDTKGTLFQPYRPRDHVKAMYKSLRPFDTAGANGGYTYDCACDRNILAYVIIEYNEAPEDPIIYLCKKFRSGQVRVAGGTDTKAGTLIHEATHFPFVRPRAQDIAYDVENAKTLASKPFEATRNADSYEYFAEGHYTPSMNEGYQRVKPAGT